MQQGDTSNPYYQLYQPPLHNPSPNPSPNPIDPHAHGSWPATTSYASAPPVSGAGYPSAPAPSDHLNYSSGYPPYPPSSDHIQISNPIAPTGFQYPYDQSQPPFYSYDQNQAALNYAPPNPSPAPSLNSPYSPAPCAPSSYPAPSAAPSLNSLFDDYGRPINLSKGGDSSGSRVPTKVVKAIPKADTEEDARNGVQKFRVKLLSEGFGQTEMDVLCQIGLDGIRMLDPATGRTLRIYSFDTMTRWEVLDSYIFAFWAKTLVDIEPKRIRLKSNSYTTRTILDTVTAASVQLKEMSDRKETDYAMSSEQQMERKKGLADWMNFIKPPNEEKDHWIPDEAVAKCTSCGTNFNAFVRKHHCRNCGEIFCDKCTQGRTPLTNDEEAQPVRVCDRCMHLKDELSKIDETWAAARFDSLPHVVKILTGKDRETELHALREQSEFIEDVVDEVVQTYHNGFNRAIQNYSQILRLFSESAENVAALKTHLPEAQKRLAARNKQLHQFWYRSVTLRHIISLLDQIEKISKIPERIEKFIAEKQYYAAIQLHMQSALMLEREGLQSVGALQDVRTELNKLRTLLFEKVMEDLHDHLYNKGEYSSNYGHGEEGALNHNETLVNGSTQANGCRSAPKDNSVRSHQVPPWLSAADPDEFLDVITKNDAALHVKYLRTMIECLCKLGKVASAGETICQNLRPTLHEILTSKIKRQAELVKSSGPSISQATDSSLTVQYLKGQLEIHQLPKKLHQNGVSMSRTSLAVSPVTPGMAPMGPMQAAAKELLNSIFYTLSKIFENLVIVGELLESKVSQKIEMNTSKPSKKKSKRKAESDGTQVTGRFNVAFSLTVLQSECQQLICEILRATPEAASADAAVQTARLASQVPSKEERDGSEDGLTFAFCFADATVSIVNQGWSKKSSSKLQEGYGSAAVLPERGIYLAAAVYHPVIKFTDKLASLLPQNFPQLGNDGLLAFIENFVKDRFLPAMFVDYRKSVQQAISSPTAFRPHAHASAFYSPYVEKGRPVLQGLLAIDLLAKELLGWAQGMPRFAAELVKFVQALFERAYERCRTSFMEAVLEKQCYMLVGRHDVESLMQLDPASSCLTNFTADLSVENNASDAYSTEVETEMNDLLWSLCPIKQDNLIHDDSKLILLASLSDSLEYVADSIESIAPVFSAVCNQVDDKINKQKTSDSKEATEKDLALFADDYRKLAVDCLKILRIEMQLETVFHMQEITSREYMDDQDAEEPDDFITSLTTQITRRDEEIASFVATIKRNYVFGGIGSVAAYASIKALAEMKSINLFGVQQICRNSIALEQALAAIPSINGRAVLLSLDRVRTYYELLNMPFEGLLAFITEHENLFSDEEYSNLLNVQVPGREIPADAQNRISDMLFR